MVNVNKAVGDGPVGRGGGGGGNSGGTGVPSTPPPSPPKANKGAYKIYPLDADGRFLFKKDADGNLLDGDEGRDLEYIFDPTDPRAEDIYFALETVDEEPPNDQLELQRALAEVMKAVQKLYRKDGVPCGPFRIFYIRIFELARLGLQGKALPGVANSELESVVDDLLISEGPKIKNARLKNLASLAGRLSILLLGFYILLASFETREPFEALFGLDAGAAKSFMILWIGTLVGVCLSYAFRKAEFKLRDLTVPEADFLEPSTRLIFAGTLATVLGFLLLLGLVKIQIGSIELTAFTTNLNLAFVFGVVMGINEILLPQSIAKRTNDIWEKIA